jgi:hypothetical protein
MLRTLSRSEPVPSPSEAIDKMMLAIGDRHHPNMWRTVRKKLTHISSASLENTSRLFPEALSGIISGGERIMSSGMDNVIRHALCASIDSDNKTVLRVFKKLGIDRYPNSRKH